jgi:hypothetical protein
LSKKIDPLKKDFRNFLYLVFAHLNIAKPTPIQYDIATFLQYGPDRLVIEAFRGVGKSWITAAYVLWRLYCNPNCKILVVSASAERAKMFTTFCLRLIKEVPILQHLKPRDDQRDSVLGFDVNGAEPDQSPSMRAVGITGTMTGGRADVIVPDDVEVPKNSATEMQRQKLSEGVKEFDAVLKPGGQVRYLGTPQCEFSLYNTLAERGYQLRIWPARYPDAARRAYYGDKLAPMIRDAVEANINMEGKPTEPTRFPELELIGREASYGRSGFDLQFMLDTRTSDLHKFPLRLSDLIAMYCNRENAPQKPIWGPAPEKIINDVPTVGRTGDRFYLPMQTQGNWIEYTGALMTIDPSGRGKDETAYTVTKMLNGYIYLLDAGGLMGGATDENLKKLVSVAKEYGVNQVLIEENFGDGMFLALISPHFEREYPVGLEEVRATGQKELRIIDTLEPVLTQHRLVVDIGLIQRDYESVQKYDDEVALTYSLFHQLTRITRDRGALVHDDRLDALQMAAAYWMQQMARDVGKLLASQEKEERRKEAEEFAKAYHRSRKTVITKPLWAKRR